MAPAVLVGHPVDGSIGAVVDDAGLLGGSASASFVHL